MNSGNVGCCRFESSNRPNSLGGAFEELIALHGRQPSPQLEDAIYTSYRRLNQQVRAGKISGEEADERRELYADYNNALYRHAP